jgi:competence protein ComEC
VASAPLRQEGSSGPTSLARAAAFAAGTVLPFQTPLHWPAVLAPVAVLCVIPSFRRVRYFVLPFLLGAAAGVGHRLADPVPAMLRVWSEHGFRPGVTPVEIVGRLLDADDLSDGRLSLTVRAATFEIPGRLPFLCRPARPILVRITTPAPGPADPPGPRPGDLVRISSRLGPPRTFRNPGAFDYSSYLRARGIDLVGTSKSARLLEVLGGDRDEIAALPSMARRSLLSTLRRAAKDRDDGTVPFLAALLIGERDDLSPEFQDRLIRAGVYHIVALSGFNVALLVGLAAMALRLLPLSPRTRRVVLALCVLLYWGAVRASGSIARAALMSLLSLGGAVQGRGVRGRDAIGTASLLIVGSNPAWAFDPGFQLSVAATLGLLLLVTPRSAGAGNLQPPGEPRPLRVGMSASIGWILASLKVSAAALLSTALVSARHFQTLTPIAVLANLFAVPLAALLLVVGLLVCVIEPLGHPVAVELINVAGALVLVLERATSIVSTPAWCSFFVLPPPVWLILMGQAAIVVAGHGDGWVRRAAWLFLALAIALTALAGRAPASNGRLEVTALDVGQGDALLVRFPAGPTMLIDAGGFARSQFDVGSKVVAPALRSLGLLKIDILAITHAHRDHLGGAAAVVGSFAPGAVWLGRMPVDDAAVQEIEALAKKGGGAIVFPRRGVRIVLGGTCVDVLNPGRGVDVTGPARNDDSLVLRVSFGAHGVLLTGDLESALETILLGEGREIGADLLKVGHHGSRTSTTGPFLRAIGPKLGVISVGATNPWGHPDAEVLGRLRDAGVEVYRTDRDGAVRFTTDGSSDWLVERLDSGNPGSP